MLNGRKQSHNTELKTQNTQTEHKSSKTEHWCLANKTQKQYVPLLRLPILFDDIVQPNWFPQCKIRMKSTILSNTLCYPSRRQIRLGWWVFYLTWSRKLRRNFWKRSSSDRYFGQSRGLFKASTAAPHCHQISISVTRRSYMLWNAQMIHWSAATVLLIAGKNASRAW